MRYSGKAPVAGRHLLAIWVCYRENMPAFSTSRASRVSFLFSISLLGSLLIWTPACGDDDSGNGGGDTDARPGDEIAGLVSLAISPADHSLIIDGTTPATQSYTATGTFEDGSTRDLTGSVTFSVDDTDLGAFAGADFTSRVIRGGYTAVRASAGSVVGTTGLGLVMRQRHEDPASVDLPADPGTLFEGPEDPARAPQLVYPNPGVLVPPNLEELEFHFLPGTAENTVFALSFENDFTDVVVYQRCTLPMNGGCIYQPDAQLWSWIADTNRGLQPLRFSVRATDDNGTAVGASASQDIQFSFDDIRGAVYYWTTSDGTGIMRFDFAAGQTEPERFLGTELSGGTCVGCHALSRDGTKIVAEAGGQNDGRLLLLDVASGEPMVPFGSPGRSIFESWNPDGSRYVGVYGDNGATDYNLMLFDGNDGSYQESIDVGATSDSFTTHPDWSPDGSRIVYTRTGASGTNQRNFYGAIEMVTDQGGNFGGPETVVPRADGHHRFYPAFSPDGELVAYNESRCNNGNTGGECDADTDPTARLWIARAEPGATPVEMSQANTPGVRDGTADLTNSFPKWSPFIFRKDSELASRLEWITFSSTREYGLRPPPGNGTLLWMAAVDPDIGLAGGDPSYPAFALPFQDLGTSNHIAQWTEEVVPPIE